jgi:outer membrane protein OmpA-like peptidoglycan-associated protein
MHSRVLKSVSRVLSLAIVALAPVALAAQAAPAAKGTPSDQYASRFDIFAGYSYLAPKGTVNTPQPNGTINTDSYDAVNVGGIFSGAYYFNRFVGAQVEYDIHEWGQQPAGSGTNVGTNGNDDGFQGFDGGIIFRFPTANITPFVHALVGTSRIDGPDHNGFRWGPTLTVGGGMDYETPLFNHHLAIRLFQADYQYMHADFGTGVYGGRANINAARLSAGVVLHVGSIAPPPPVTLSCSSNPDSVFPGTPVTITATAGSLDPKMNAVYSWSGTGVTGNGPTATVATDSLAPGSYTVQGTVKEGKKGKEGEKPWETANCSASFTVKAYEPPTISCSASPDTIKPGETSTITATAVSPQNLPLTYSYSASAGEITGNGTTAVYSSTGAPTGAVGITCKVSDNKGNTASADTTVNIVQPPAPPKPTTQALCSISFTTDKRRPMRVDNEAKACLDQVAIDLQQQPDAKVVVVGQSDAHEKEITARQEKYAEHHHHARIERFAAQRAVNTKDYLVTEKGIDPSRISAATSDTDGQQVLDYLVPSGADFNTDVPGTTPVNESDVTPQKRVPLPERHHHHAAAK